MIDPGEQRLLAALYEAFNRRDVDTVLAALHPEVDWPNGMEGGRVVGHQAVRAYWQRQFAVIQPTVRPVSFVMLEDGRVRVLVHSTVRDLAGAVLDERRVVHVYRFVDGLIVSMEIEPVG